MSITDPLARAAQLLDQPGKLDALAIDLMSDLVQEVRDLRATYTELDKNNESLTSQLAEARSERFAAEQEIHDLRARLTEAETDFEAFAEHHRATEQSWKAQAARLAALEQERDEARVIVANVNNSVFGSQGYFTQPDCVEAIEKLKALSNQRYNEGEAQIAALQPLAQALAEWYWAKLTVDNERPDFTREQMRRLINAEDALMVLAQPFTGEALSGRLGANNA